MNYSNKPTIPDDIPAVWTVSLRSQLAPDEHVVAWMRLDLNAQLKFADGLLVLTNQRLLARYAPDSTWQVIDISANSIMHRHDHAGVASIVLEDGGTRVGSWHYTLAHNAAAQRLAQAFATRLQPAAADDEIAVCSNCLAPLPDGETECAICEQTEATASSTWALLRLGRFARPYQWQLVLGFLLTLGATAATLVPPYLTMPLMDDVLIPFQNGKPIDAYQVMPYILG
ncbi:MAG: ABC transporter, partial [Sulfuriferula sp.]